MLQQKVSNYSKNCFCNVLLPTLMSNMSGLSQPELPVSTKWECMQNSLRAWQICCQNRPLPRFFWWEGRALWRYDQGSPVQHLQLGDFQICETFEGDILYIKTACCFPSKRELSASQVQKIMINLEWKAVQGQSSLQCVICNIWEFSDTHLNRKLLLYKAYIIC